MLTAKKRRVHALTERITIKVEPSQKRRFQEQAEAQGMTESEYGRALLFEASRRTEHQTLKQIGNIVGLIAQRVGISPQELTSVMKGKA